MLPHYTSMDLIIFVANDNIKRAGGFVQVLEAEDEGIITPAWTLLFL